MKAGSTGTSRAYNIIYLAHFLDFEVLKYTLILTIKYAVHELFFYFFILEQRETFKPNTLKQILNLKF